MILPLLFLIFAHISRTTGQAVQKLKCGPFSANFTASATQNYVLCQIDSVCSGVVLHIGDCSGSCVGDQYIRLFDANNSVELTANDDGSCESPLDLCSYTTYSYNGSECVSLMLRQGCYGDESCSGNMKVNYIYTATPTAEPTSVPSAEPTTSTPSASPTNAIAVGLGESSCIPYSAVETNNAKSNYAVCLIEVCPGTQLTIGDCDSSCVGDQFIRLYDTYGNILTYDDDGCFDGPYGFCSSLSYVYHSGPCQVMSLHQGCADNDSCSGVMSVVRRVAPAPSALPTAIPSVFPSAQPSFLPTSIPTFIPSSEPTVHPTPLPTALPSTQPTSSPTEIPSSSPSSQPSSCPSSDPTSLPTSQPTFLPSAKPSSLPSDKPTSIPTLTPSSSPSAQPTQKPSSFPSASPSSFTPTQTPTVRPSAQPSTPAPTMPPKTGFSTSNIQHTTKVTQSVWYRTRYVGEVLVLQDCNYGYVDDSTCQAMYPQSTVVSVDVNGNSFKFAVSSELRAPTGLPTVNPASIPVLSFSERILYTVAGNGVRGYSGDGLLGTLAQLSRPGKLCVDLLSAYLYIADVLNFRVRRVSLLTGIITLVAGDGTFQPGYASPKAIGDGGLAVNATVYPSGLAFDSSGNLIIGDAGHNRIRMVDVFTGLISTIAGNGYSAFAGDGLLAKYSSFDGIIDIAIDTLDNIYIADSGNFRIRKITAATGIMSTVAGNGRNDFSGDGGLATLAAISGIQGVAVDSAFNIIFPDTFNCRIRKVSSVTGIITTIVGTGDLGFSGDGGLATNAVLSRLFDVFIDEAGNLVFADSMNNRIRRVDASTGIISTIAGTGVAGSFGAGGYAMAAGFQVVKSVTMDNRGIIYASDDIYVTKF